MKIKKFKSNYWTYLLTLSSLILIFQKVQSESKALRQFRSYSSYSPSTNQDYLNNGSQIVTELKNNRIEDTTASRRSSHGPNQNGQSVFYYETFPASVHHGYTQQGSYQNVDATVPQYQTPVPQPQSSRVNYAPSKRQYSSPLQYYPSQELGAQPLEYAASLFDEDTTGFGLDKQDFGIPGLDGLLGGLGGAAGQDGTAGLGEAGGLAGLGGASGLLGLLGLSGLTGLKPYILEKLLSKILRKILVLKLLPLLIPLIPILPLLALKPLIPLLIALLSPLLILLLLLIPIPVIVTGNTAGRSFDTSNLFSINGTEVSFTLIDMKSVIPKLASDVLEAEECVERISCEIARMSRKYNVSQWMDIVTDNLPKDNRYVKKIQKGLRRDRELRQENGNPTMKANIVKEGEKFKGKDEGGECAVFKCKPRPNFARYLVK